MAYEGGVEIFVLEGAFEDEQGLYEKHSWLRLPAHAAHTPVSPQGCELYIKMGALPGLHSA